MRRTAHSDIGIWNASFAAWRAIQLAPQKYIGNTI